MHPHRKNEPNESTAFASLPVVIHPALILAGAILAVAMIAGCSKSNAPVSSGTTAVASATPVVNCATAVSTDKPPNVIDSTCATIPLDVTGIEAQGSFDLFGWLTFVAVNWPVNAAQCTPNAQASILTSPPDPTWLSYLDTDTIFVASGSPANWCNSSGKAGATGAYFASMEDARAAERAAKIKHLPLKVRKLAEQHKEVRLFLHHSAKSHALTSTIKLSKAAVSSQLQGILQATGQPLTDQNGRFVRYTIQVNQDEDSYIMAKSLWKASGQKAAGNLSFPYSMQSSATELGSMEFKAAWKVLGANDDASHFFTMQAIVYNDQNGDPSPGQNPVTVGLVGLHITHKTKAHQTWTWSTFEQVENRTKSFYNPNCPASQCPPNVETATPPYTELNPNGTPINKPVQVVAQSQPSTPQYNTLFQGLLKGTPWAYYQLISTQWSGETLNPNPNLLGNAVLETFMNNSSCIACHKQATDLPQNANSDFSFAITANQ